MLAVKKFRARTFDNEWVYWSITGQKPVGIDKSTITQYTNNDDLKMNEIYEGDLFQYEGGIDEVRWGVDGWVVGEIDPKYLGEVNGVVVGNKYEHKGDI